MFKDGYLEMNFAYLGSIIGMIVAALLIVFGRVDFFAGVYTIIFLAAIHMISLFFIVFDPFRRAAK